MRSELGIQFCCHYCFFVMFNDRCFYIFFLFEIKESFFSPFFVHLPIRNLFLHLSVRFSYCVTLRTSNCSLPLLTVIFFLPLSLLFSARVKKREIKRNTCRLHLLLSLSLSWRNDVRRPFPLFASGGIEGEGREKKKK